MTIWKVHRQSGYAIQSVLRLSRVGWSFNLLDIESASNTGKETIESIKILSEIAGTRNNEHINLKPFNPDWIIRNG
jgi:hypothetical protein